ncbi:hypothetical protein [Helicobacter saguini]|uniref:Uncharacterized protein n=1 Tax=Helicobacter saguini TaxID=1548018 RepID=A0A6L7D4R9_9HELI|nr:hypothetical protein [Helicobacter saguini]MWV69082.1 hypothetical protein [Helicobacter saguini]
MDSNANLEIWAKEQGVDISEDDLWLRNVKSLPSEFATLPLKELYITIKETETTQYKEILQTILQIKTLESLTIECESHAAQIAPAYKKAILATDFSTLKNLKGLRLINGGGF